MPIDEKRHWIFCVLSKKVSRNVDLSNAAVIKLNSKRNSNKWSVLVGFLVPVRLHENMDCITNAKHASIPAWQNTCKNNHFCLLDTVHNEAKKKGPKALSLHLAVGYFNWIPSRGRAGVFWHRLTNFQGAWRGRNVLKSSKSIAKVSWTVIELPLARSPYLKPLNPHYCKCENFVRVEKI